MRTVLYAHPQDVEAAPTGNIVLLTPTDDKLRNKIAHQKAGATEVPGVSRVGTVAASNNEFSFTARTRFP